jgi:Cytochrome c7 and related cytochrome c/Class III cytochrome C family
LSLCFFLLLSAAVASTPAKPQAPLQPIPYSHKLHLALGLKCKDCHEMPTPGEAMTLPEASKCMPCHTTIGRDRPAIQKLSDYARQKRSIPWIRVYEIPSFVFFSHKTHLDAGVKCESCHGPVAQRDRLWRETPFSMAWCTNCHRASKATTDCGSCHQLQN